MQFSVDQILSVCGASLLIGEKRPIEGASIDSRLLAKGQLFVAIKTANRDGADYISEAIEKGASAILTHPLSSVQRKKTISKSAVLEVPDPVEALAALATDRLQAWRATPGSVVVGITGSNGKTSTRELAFGILAEDRSTYRAEKNFNNLLGVPLAILNADASAHAMVFEMGISEPGEMDRLVSIVRPDVAILTTVSPAHLKDLGSLDGVYEEKLKIFSQLDSKQGVAIYPYDDARIRRRVAKRVAAKQIGFGFESGSDIQVLSYQTLREGARFEVRVENKTHSLTVNLFGQHMVLNASAAIAVGHALGISWSKIGQGLANVKPVGGRLGWQDLTDTVAILNDTYNANPASVRAALRTLSELAKQAGRRPIAILGDMAELGPDSAVFHERIAEHLLEFGVEVVWCVGQEIHRTFEHLSEMDAFRGKRFFSEGFERLPDGFEAAALQSPVLCLIKGSRSSQTERAIDRLRSAVGSAVNGSSKE